MHPLCSTDDAEEIMKIVKKLKREISKIMLILHGNYEWGKIDFIKEFH